MKTFSVVDWIEISLMIIAMLYIGIKASRRNVTSQDYLVGGKHQKSEIVGLSLFAALFSALSYLSCPGETIKNGPLFLSGMLAYPFAAWVIGRCIIPRFCRYNVTSGYQLLEIELGKQSRNLAALFFVLLRFMWMSTIMYAMVDKALLPMFGLSAKWAIPISVILILITVMYTSIGGISAVLKTDALQSAIMFLGAILTIAVVLISLPSASILFDPSTYSHWQPFEWKPSFSTRMTVFNLFLMEFCWQVSTAGSDQMAMQRYFSVKDAKSAAKSFYISIASSAAIKILLAFVGILVMAYFACYPDNLPYGSSIQDCADSLFPYFILTGLSKGVTGLIAAALMAAAMSSLSSGLISVATVIQEDIIKQYVSRGNDMSVRQSRRISIIVGILVAVSCFFIAKIPGNLYDITMKVTNLVVEPLFVLFFVALFIPKGTDKGAVIGGCASLLAASVIAFASGLNISELWIGPLSLVVGVAVACFFSLTDMNKIQKHHV